MKTTQRNHVGTALLLMMILPLTLLLAAGPVAVDLKSAAHFVVLSGAAITSTGGGLLHGDVGASPISGAAIGLTTAQVDGVIYSVDAAGPAGSVMDPSLLLEAKTDLSAAYSNAALRLPVPEGDFLNPGSGNIGGLSLGPGLYKFPSSALISGLSATLTGGVDDVWIFQVGSTLTVGGSIQVVLAGGAQARNVFWQVGTSATIGTGASFKGTIMADQSITMDAGSTIEGRALAVVAAVTFNGAIADLPVPEAPEFVDITRVVGDSTTLVLATTPFFLLTLQTSTNLILPHWTTIATQIPGDSLCTFIDDVSTTPLSRRFYRAFVTR